MIRSSVSERGFRTLHIADKQIHSLYNPVAEAKRFIQDIPNCQVLVLLGASVGYLSAALKARFPNARIIAVYFHSELFSLSSNRPDYCWHPGLLETMNKQEKGDAEPESALASFFFSHIFEYEIAALQVVEWPPMAEVFGKYSTMARSALRMALNKLRDNTYTIATFGKRWIQNSIRNYLRYDTRPQVQTDAAVVIAAPGWSLQYSMPFITRFRNNIVLCALSSAASILLAKGLIPDYIMHSDGGYWAGRYLTQIPSHIPLVSALQACIPSRYGSKNTGVMLFSHDTPFEKAICTYDRLFHIPEHVTVSGAALDFAASITRRAVIFAGLDLCPYDIASHARPHASERYILLRTNRVYQEEYLRFIHSRKVMAPTLNIYAEWFRTRMQETPAIPVLRLNAIQEQGKPVRTAVETAAGVNTGIRSIKAEDLKQYTGGRSKKHAVFHSQCAPPLSERRSIIQSIIHLWREKLGRNPGDLASVAEIAHAISPIALHRHMQSGQTPETGKKLLDELHAFLSDMEDKYCA